MAGPFRAEKLTGSANALRMACDEARSLMQIANVACHSRSYGSAGYAQTIANQSASSRD